MPRWDKNKYSSLWFAICPSFVPRKPMKRDVTSFSGTRGCRQAGCSWVTRQQNYNRVGAVEI